LISLVGAARLPARRVREVVARRPSVFVRPLSMEEGRKLQPADLWPGRACVVSALAGEDGATPFQVIRHMSAMPTCPSGGERGRDGVVIGCLISGRIGNPSGEDVHSGGTVRGTDLSGEPIAGCRRERRADRGVAEGDTA